MNREGKKKEKKERKSECCREWADFEILEVFMSCDRWGERKKEKDFVGCFVSK